MLTIGGTELGMIPRIAVPLTDTAIGEDAARAAGLADVFELRIDLFEKHDPEYVRQACERARVHRVPLLATVRSAREGGAVDLDDEARCALLEGVMPLVDAVDIEFHCEVRNKIIKLARAQHKLSIVSYHDFERTPRDDDLVAIIDSAKLNQADIVKLAVTAKSVHDLDRLLGLLREYRDKQLVLVAMGEHGRASRVFFPLFGSLLTYGFLDQAVAPGQLSLEDLAAELRRYSPAYAQR